MKKVGKLIVALTIFVLGMIMTKEVYAGDMPANPVDKPGYTLDYADEFDGDSLDKTK